jgi:hypothetical protein
MSAIQDYSKNDARLRREKTSSFSLGYVFKGWWWVMVFCAICISIYAQGMMKKEMICSELKEKITYLEEERISLKNGHDDLQLEIASQNDPAWIELVLMKHLGVVPEGNVKVHFKQEGIGN